MRPYVQALITSAFFVTSGAIAALAQQERPGSLTTQQPIQERIQPHEMMGPNKMEHQGMDHGMPGRGGMIGYPPMMRVIFILMDSNGDGTISLSEFQAAHERIFKAMDANKDGELTFDEMQAFMQGSRAKAQP